MLLKSFLLLFVIAYRQDVLASSSRMKNWPKLLETYKNILLNSYDMLQQEWQIFKETHGKKYDTDEEDIKRMEIFAHNKLIIARHNDLYKKRVVTYTVKMNKFGDMTTKEFNTYYGFKNTFEEEDTNRNEITPTRPISGMKTIPKEKDWRKEGAVTRVKDQKRRLCGGSSWAFSVTGVLEGYYFIKNFYLIELSEQNLIDCTTNQGCSGGTTAIAFSYVGSNGGINSESSYPYDYSQGQCRYNKTYAIPCAQNFQYVPIGDETALEQFVANYGPVSVMVDTTDETFRFYDSGVYSSYTCSSELRKLNNALLVVGYGHDIYGGEYWLVKNSWGTNWGEKGYIKMAKNNHNNCGIATEAILPYDY